IEATISQVAVGEQRCFTVIVRDITERRQAETSLQESELRFRQLADNVNDVFWMVDPHKPELLYLNRAFEPTFGRSLESVYAQPRLYLESIHPEDQERMLGALHRQRRGERTSEEYRVVRPDGSVRWVWGRG